MMNTIAPVWDGNATWLVFGGACLYGAFPLAYSTLLPALYMPIMIMLAALIFRGISFEFRFKATVTKWIWDKTFFMGSLLATFMQGTILGAFIQGYYAKGWYSPFSLMIGVALVVGYALLGSTWLIAKTVGDLQKFMYKIARFSLIGVGGFIALVSLLTPLVDPHVMERWFSIPNIYYLSLLPILTAVAWIFTWRSLLQEREFLPFYLSNGLFMFSYIGLAISIWPYIVPHKITIWQAASSPKSLSFLLVGVIILLPILIGYTLYAYSVFKGKVTVGKGHY